MDTREKHFPGYNYCGPGTNFAKRSALGIEPVNRLDALAYVHDIATEPRGPFTSGNFGPLIRQADKALLLGALKLKLDPMEDHWAIDAVITAMTFVLATGARGRGLVDI